MSADLDEMLSMLGVSDTKEEAATKETKDEAPAAADAPADAPVESSTGPATRPARPPPPKTLADAEARQGTTYKVKVALAPETARNLAEFPYPLDGSLSEEAEDGGRKVFSADFNVFYSDEDGEDLLKWFSGLAGSSSVKSLEDVLLFPSSFTKEQRARWHRLADNLGLESASEGVGDGRHLTVRLREGTAAAQPKAQPGKAGASGRDKVRQRASQIYSWCQAEGGPLMKYSKGELQEALAGSGELPADIQRLILKRETARSLMRQLAARDVAGSLALLRQDPSLAWVRDDQAGGYPLHMAAYHGVAEVAALIAQQKTTLQQRDRQRKTPLQVARATRQEAVVRVLLEAGAGEAPGGSGKPAEQPAAAKPQAGGGGDGSPQEPARAPAADSGSPGAEQPPLELVLMRGGREVADARELLRQPGPLKAVCRGQEVLVRPAASPTAAAALGALLDACAAMEAACALLRQQASQAAPAQQEQRQPGSPAANSSQA